MKPFFFFLRDWWGHENTLQNGTKPPSQGTVHSGPIRAEAFLSLNSSRASSAPAISLPTQPAVTVGHFKVPPESPVLPPPFCSPTDQRQSMPMEGRELNKEENTETEKEAETKCRGLKSQCSMACWLICNHRMGLLVLLYPTLVGESRPLPAAHRQRHRSLGPANGVICLIRYFWANPGVLPVPPTRSAMLRVIFTTSPLSRGYQKSPRMRMVLVKIIIINKWLASIVGFLSARHCFKCYRCVISIFKTSPKVGTIIILNLQIRSQGRGHSLFFYQRK